MPSTLDTEPDKPNVTFAVEAKLLEKMDEKAARMDLNRSQYVRRLVKRDLGLSLEDFSPSPVVGAGG